MLVGKNLHFDVSRRGDVLFHKHHIVAEGASSFRFSRVELIHKYLRRHRNPHTLTSAPFHSLEEYREANLLGLFFQEGRILIVTMVSRYTGYAGRDHYVLGPAVSCQPGRDERHDRADLLFPIASIASHGGPMNTSPESVQSFAKAEFSLSYYPLSIMGSFSETVTYKAVPRVDAVASLLLRNLNDPLPIEISGRMPEVDRMSGAQCVLGLGIRIRIDGRSLDPILSCGSPNSSEII